MPQFSLGYLIAGTMMVALVGAVALAPDEPFADMRLSPATGTIAISDTITVVLEVESTTPVNVFGGEIDFNSDIMIVESINYNTEVADLWAVEPWYENGAGTISFAGGTTKPDGYTGSDPLIEVTFKAINSGEGVLSIKDGRIIQHDGLGTEADVEAPIDAIFNITEAELERETIAKKTSDEGEVRVVTELPSKDLNDDGSYSFGDVSIFLVHIAQQNPLSDFNVDGTVNGTDLSILLGAIN